MIPYFKNLVNKINSLKYFLILANTLLVGVLISLSNLNILPIKNIGDFLFISLMIFIFTLYRPGWGFLFFIGTLSLENINLAPLELGISIRPYQILGFLTFLSVGIRHLSKRLNFSLPKFIWADYILILFAMGGFLASINAQDNSLAFKQSFIILSFIILYLLIRIFIQNLEDIKKIIPFFLSSAMIVMLYGVWQNYRFGKNLNSFEVMPGRVNATFTEADWFGIFLAFLLSILYVVVYKLNQKIDLFGIKKNKTIFIYTIFAWLLILLGQIDIILTVSRSAWLGWGMMLVLFLAYLALKKKLKLILFILASLIFSIGLIFIFKLTNFDLSNRVQSTTSGNQEITIACKSEVVIESPIENVTLLSQYGCTHINLEDIEKEFQSGKIIKKIYRKDPNVSIRKEIYFKTLTQIKEDWFLGIGWGNISSILGKDERGAGLNSSNIFLEVWLGAGLLGLISFLIIIGYIVGAGKMFFWKKFRDGKFRREDAGMDFFYLFLILSSIAIIIPNFFNAGIMLGFLWLWIGISFVRE